MLQYRNIQYSAMYRAVAKFPNGKSGAIVFIESLITP